MEEADPHVGDMPPAPVVNNDGHGDNPQGAVDPHADAEMRDADAIGDNADLKAVNSAIKTLKPTRYDGTGDVTVWLKALLFQLSLFVPALTDPQLAIAVVACLTGKAAHALLSQFDAALLRTGAIGLQQLSAWLTSAFGRAKPTTDMSVRHELQSTQPKRKNGQPDYLGHVQWFQQRVSVCPHKPDDITLIFWLQQQLPSTIQQLLHTDANNQPYTDFALYATAVTNHLAILAAATDKAGSSKGADNESKRKANAGSNAAKKAKFATEGKPFVANLSPEVKKYRMEKGLCLKCGEAGHRVATCKNKPK